MYRTFLAQAAMAVALLAAVRFSSNGPVITELADADAARLYGGQVYGYNECAFQSTLDPVTWCGGFASCLLCCLQQKYYTDGGNRRPGSVAPCGDNLDCCYWYPISLLNCSN